MAKDNIFNSVVEQRLIVCNSCEQKTKLIKIDICSVCKCVIELKVRVKSQRCPIGKWLEYKEKD